MRHVLRRLVTKDKHMRWNPKQCGPHLAISQDGLRVDKIADDEHENGVYADVPVYSGRFVFAVDVYETANWWAGVGIGDRFANPAIDDNMGQDTHSLALFEFRETFLNAVQIHNASGTWPLGGFRMLIAVDADRELVWFKEGEQDWNYSGSANPDTNTGGRDYSLIANPIAPGVALWKVGDYAILDPSPRGHGLTTFGPWPQSALDRAPRYLHSLREDFNDVIDTSNWMTFGDMAVVGPRLQIPFNSDYSAGIISRSIDYQFIDSSVTVELGMVDHNTSSELTIEILDKGVTTNALVMLLTTGGMRLVKKVGGVSTDLATGDVFDNFRHRWVRISEKNRAVTVETSPTGLPDTWTVYTSAALDPALQMRKVRLSLWAGAWSTPGGYAWVNNINTGLS